MAFEVHTYSYACESNQSFYSYHRFLSRTSIRPCHPREAYRGSSFDSELRGHLAIIGSFLSRESPRGAGIEHRMRDR